MNFGGGNSWWLVTPLTRPKYCVDLAQTSLTAPCKDHYHSGSDVFGLPLKQEESTMSRTESLNLARQQLADAIPESSPPRRVERDSSQPLDQRWIHWRMATRPKLALDFAAIIQSRVTREPTPQRRKAPDLSPERSAYGQA